jgi:hypothetical protein
VTDMGKRAGRFSTRFKIRNIGSSGLEFPCDRHPFLRDERYGDDPPRVIRWMWHPRTGDALLGVFGRHADILRRFGMKSRRRMAPFSHWLRGFYFPRTGELVMRPFDVSAIGCDGDWKLSDRMQRHVQRLIERQLGRKITKRRFHMNVDNEWLTRRYGGRW